MASGVFDLTGRRALITGSGQGIGLAVVREIVGLYGGSVHIGRGPLGGAEVTVHLPKGTGP